MVRALTIISAVLILGCASSRGRYSMLKEGVFPPHSADYDIEIFMEGVPDKPYEEISRLDVHLEKTHFVTSSLKNALPLLKEQARQSGADAIINIKELRSRVLETHAYHVTATGIKYK